MTQKITIIGGSGFLGTNLCRQLSLNAQEFEIIDLKMSREFSENCKIGDIRDKESLRKTITGNVIVNLAAVHKDDIRDRSEYQRTNVIGAKNLAMICSEKGIKHIIFTSSVAVYGFAKIGTGESGDINPFNDYGRTKFEAEEILRQWQRDDGNALTIIRPTVIFGEGNRGNVFNLFNWIASGKFLMVGNGQNKKSMAYVGNVVAFLERCIANKQHYALYNYVDTPDLTMNELVSFVQKNLKGQEYIRFRLPFAIAISLGYLADLVSLLTGKTLSLSAIRVKKFVSSTEFSSAKSELGGFEPPFKLLEGVERTLQSEFISPSPNQEIFYTE